MPFFSIVIPTYNRAPLIGKAIESVLAQEFTDWELVIIDDGSTDNTGEIVKRYNDSRIHYHWKINEERSVARNTGISMSRGEYICFLDSDDYYLPQHLLTLYSEITAKDRPVALFCTGAKVIGDKSYDLPVYNNVDAPPRYIFFHKLDMNTVCVHRNILQKHRFNEKQMIGEDTNLWIRITCEFPMFGIHKHTTVTVQHDNSGMVNYYRDPNIGMLKLYVNSAKDFFASSGIKSYVTQREMDDYLLKKYVDTAYSGIFFRKFPVFYYCFPRIIALRPGYVLSSRFLKMLKEYFYMQGRILFKK